MRMMRMVTLYRTLLLLILAVGFNAPAAADEDANRVRFDRDIRPLLSDRCFHCHGPDTEQRQADLRLDRKDDAFAPRDGHPALTAGSLDQSSVWARISTNDESERMPPSDSNKKLTPAEIELIKRWIEQGAEWTDHWAFVAPTRPVVPEVDDALPAVNPIDHFIYRRLKTAGLAPTGEADRRTLIRRVTLDLIGLPPTPDQVEQFVNDTSPTAYETVVDRLLQSPHFGERMAVMWLDAARYGDTSVFHADGPRDMWGWRDRVVRAYNQNMPFDRFSILQLAGDLVPDAHVEDRMLAGFNRNNGTTDEGGAIAEEYRVEYVVDRVKTTSTVWLGLSMECGQCHDHKYDPISQEDYYRFYAFFNVSSDGGMQTRNGNAQPILEIPDAEKQARLPEIQQKLAEVENQLADRRTAADVPFSEWVTAKEKEIAANPEASTPTGMSLHIALDEGSGAEVTNLAQPEQTGKIEGQPEWVDGRLDKALKLNGSTYVDLGDVGRFERTDSVSYGGWIKLPKNGSGALLARMDDANSYRGYDCLISGGKIAPHIIHKWPENAIKVQTKKALEADKWHHVMVTYDGSSKAAGMKIYVDGEVWEWDVQQDSLSDTIITEKTLLIGSRHPSSRLTGEVDDVRLYPRLLSEAEVKQLAGADPIVPILQLAAADRSETQRNTLFDYYLNNVDTEFQKLSREQNGLKQQQIELAKPLTTVMIMNDMAKPRDTFMLSRGRYDAPTDHQVTAGTPAILPPMSDSMPSNRLGLAQWLFEKEHPLTARVAVNRYWQMLFGRGLVNTPDDFGSQGDFPTHPELLDWLAVDFRESGWNIKRILKTIVMSHTYRQSSRVTPELWQRDPENRLLARGARFRLQGEFIRDQALAVSGLLNDRMGGPGVKPYQPPGLWAEVGLGGNPKFVQDHGEALYRRSLYTYWKRSAPPPNMQIFDAPTREKCQVKRARTNTPLQALVLLNDVQFVEAARHLAARIMRECSDAPPAKRIERGMLLTTARSPSETELQALTELYEISLAKFQGDSEAAKELLGFGESKNVGELDPAEHAAWTIVASTLMNLDETVVRN